MRVDYKFIPSASISSERWGAHQMWECDVPQRLIDFTDTDQVKRHTEALRTDVNTSSANIDLSETQLPRHSAPPSEI